MERMIPKIRIITKSKTITSGNIVHENYVQGKAGRAVCTYGCASLKEK